MSLSRFSWALLLLFGCEVTTSGGGSGGGDDAQVPSEIEAGQDAGATDAASGHDAGFADDADIDADTNSDAETRSDAEAADAQTDAGTVCDGGASCHEADACVAAAEACNGTDDDCDGTVDEGCYQAPFTVLDFDVTDDGRAVAVGASDNKITMVCFAADGTVAKTSFEVAAPPADGLKQSYLDVARADSAGNVAISYSYWNWPGSPNDWRTFAAFFDAQCNIVRAGAALDADRLNTGIVRQASLAMTDDGHSYFIYEHQTDGVYRVLGFDANGDRIAAVTIPSSTECTGGALSRVLSLDEASGKFAVVCERSGRIYRRYLANGTPIDASFLAVPGYPAYAPFHYFGAALNADGVIAYVGRRAEDATWIFRGIQGASIAEKTLTATSSSTNPRARVTTAGNFLISLQGSGYDVVLLSPSGDVLQTGSLGSTAFELAGANRLYTVQGNRITLATQIDLTGL